MTLSKFLKIVDPSSNGYNKLTKMANNRLSKGNIAEVRESYNKQFSELINVVTDEYVNTLAHPKPYEKNKRVVNEVLRELTSMIFGSESRAKITVFKNWDKFIEASNKKEIVDSRIDYLQKFFAEYRDAFIKNVYVDDLPYNGTSFSAELKKFVSLYTELTGVRATDNETDEIKNDMVKLPNDYYVSKQQIQTVWRCDFVIATRIIERVFSKLKLKLLPEFRNISNIAKIFENGVSAFSSSPDQINVLIAPTINYVKRPNNALELHSTTTASYHSGDTDNVYYLHGVYVPKKYWKYAVDKTLTLEKFMKIKNIEQRRVVSQEAGADCFAKHPNAEKTEKSPHNNILITIRNAILPSEDPSRSGESMDIKILNYKDPSTGREYNSFVPSRLFEDRTTDLSNTIRMTDSNSRELTDPDEAMAWKFGKTKEEYYNELVLEA